MQNCKDGLDWKIPKNVIKTQNVHCAEVASLLTIAIKYWCCFPNNGIHAEEYSEKGHY